MKGEPLVSKNFFTTPVIAYPSKLSKKSLAGYLGPAFIVSIAYMDPGNFGTNISSGSQFSYTLLWVLLWSNAMAIFIQILSAKLGIATGRSLSEKCGDEFSRPVNGLLWLITTFAAMATDLAEFLGGVLGFTLLFNFPLVWSAVLTGGITYIICHLQAYGHRLIERTIALMAAAISLIYIGELFITNPDWQAVAYHTIVPSLSQDTLLLTAGMLGATIMPHVIYLHSQLVQPRRTSCSHDCAHHLKMAKFDVWLAMNMAFLVNAAMLIVSAAVFAHNALPVSSIESAYYTMQPILGPMAANAFGLALLFSGLSSTAVGTMSGEVILTGFVGFDIPVVLRRLITMLPAMLIILSGIDPMQALVYSQVVLSFSLPAAIIPLLILTSRPTVMGHFANTRCVNVLGWGIAVLIILLNAALIWATCV